MGQGRFKEFKENNLKGVSEGLRGVPLRILGASGVFREVSGGLKGD